MELSFVLLLVDNGFDEPMIIGINSNPDGGVGMEARNRREAESWQSL